MTLTMNFLTRCNGNTPDTWYLVSITPTNSHLSLVDDAFQTIQSIRCHHIQTVVQRVLGKSRQSICIAQANWWNCLASNTNYWDSLNAVPHFSHVSTEILSNFLNLWSNYVHSSKQTNLSMLGSSSVISKTNIKISGWLITISLILSCCQHLLW